MSEKANLGLDSQCFTYLISALENSDEPNDILKEEKKSLVRIFAYCNPCIWLSPKVIEEYKNIKQFTKRQKHQDWHNIHFLDITPLPDPNKVGQIAANLKVHHPGEEDCIIIAEYYLHGINTVLSYDTDLIKNLPNQGIICPSEYWKNLNIPKGTKPKIIPHHTNPLFNQNWWQW